MLGIESVESRIQQARAELSMRILNKWDQNPEGFLSWITTWLYKYDVVDKAQSEQWLPQNAKYPATVSQSGEKVIVTVFREIEGILQLEGEKQ